MPKLKTHSGASKRFSVTKNGKFKRTHSFMNHKLTKKDTKRKRGLRKSDYADSTKLTALRRMVPYR